ncbi:Glutamine synthetase 2 cytoplasmic [Eumeta japonica]|uniref:glutamine synthetase n=1 Tax=Eumeta variegata TaxID=151549 RepID=A0A4C1ZMI6_EUMVA|nr:Glutamine synthetase 2 cytoplasmic [Eumeta japonica]
MNICTSSSHLDHRAMHKYLDLEVPCEAVLASYVWVDGSGAGLRSKDRTFDFIPKSNKDLPIWYFDGSGTQQASVDNSDTFIFPEVIYHDPFRRGKHMLVLADTYMYNYSPTPTNFRKPCTIACEKAEVAEPWFGFTQELLFMTKDDRPLGWPPGGYPAPPGPYYCGIGVDRIVARDLLEAFYSTVYTGDGSAIVRRAQSAHGTFSEDGPGTNSLPYMPNTLSAKILIPAWFSILIPMPLSIPVTVGPRPGIKAADDLWMARYILGRLSEEYGVVVSYDPQPIPDWPGNGTLVYFSTEETREDDGILIKSGTGIESWNISKYEIGFGVKSGTTNRIEDTITNEAVVVDSVIERLIDNLSRRHGAHMAEYDPRDGADNIRRLTGRNGTTHVRDFTAGLWGILEIIMPHGTSGPSDPAVTTNPPGLKKILPEGVANRSCSVRIPRQVAEDKKGYFEDRRPAANADPYRIITAMLKTCVFDE